MNYFDLACVLECPEVNSGFNRAVFNGHFIVCFDHGEDSVVNNIVIVCIDAFRYEGPAFIVLDLFDAHEFHQYDVGKGAAAHIPPCFAIIVIFIHHQSFGAIGEFPVEVISLGGIEVQWRVGAQFKLDQGHDGVVDDPDVFSSDTLVNLLNSFFFDASDALCFYVDLVGNGRCPQDPPRGAIISHFRQEDLPAVQDNVIILFIGSGVGFHRKKESYGSEIMKFYDSIIIVLLLWIKFNSCPMMLDLSSPVVMGILNLTPDSFHDGGKYLHPDAQLRRVEQMVVEGAAIIDLGAISTRPGARQVCEDTELDRLIPAIKAIRHHFPEVIISVDTYRAFVAEAAVAHGANIINDIFGGRYEPEMISTIAKLNVPYIIMHMKGTPENMQDNPVYSDVTAEVLYFFEHQIARCKEHGIRQVIIDPGFGFGKTMAHNFTLLSHLDEFTSLGHPVMVGLSRKSMITKFLQIKTEEALNGTTALNTIALTKGADILRVHDVKEAFEAIRLFEALSDEFA